MTPQTLRRVLITGGAGFLGSHLCDRMIEQGSEVLCVDSLLTGAQRNIGHLLGHPRFHFIVCDVSAQLQIGGTIEAILHLASPASPKDYLKHPLPTLRVGAFGTHHALELARLKGARFLLASTSEVYGDPLMNPQPETYWGNVNPIGPRGVYDEAKRFAEALTMAYHRYYGMDTRIVRIFNTYGPRMRPDDGRVISNFIVQALRGKALTIYGDGSQTRSFCYVDDLVEGVLAVLSHPSDLLVGEGAEESSRDGSENAADSIHLPINLGNPEEHTVLEIAQIVRAAAGSDAPLQFHPLPADDPQVRCPDISRAKHLLAWEPRVCLGDGTAQTLAFFRRALSIRNVEPMRKYVQS